MPDRFGETMQLEALGGQPLPAALPTTSWSRLYHSRAFVPGAVFLAALAAVALYLIVRNPAPPVAGETLVTATVASQSTQAATAPPPTSTLPDRAGDGVGDALDACPDTPGQRCPHGTQ